MPGDRSDWLRNRSRFRLLNLGLDFGLYRFSTAIPSPSPASIAVIRTFVLCIYHDHRLLYVMNGHRSNYYTAYRYLEICEKSSRC